LSHFFYSIVNGRQRRARAKTQRNRNSNSGLSQRRKVAKNSKGTATAGVFQNKAELAQLAVAVKKSV
jgi:hypothetical protein